MRQGWAADSGRAPRGESPFQATRRSCLEENRGDSYCRGSLSKPVRILGTGEARWAQRQLAKISDLLYCIGGDSVEARPLGFLHEAIRGKVESRRCQAALGRAAA